MKTFVVLIFLALTVSAQVGMDCSSGCTGPTDEKWSDTQGNCVTGNNQSCGDHCTCNYGFLLSGANGVLTPKWFNISIRDGKAYLGEPGPLLRHRCQKGDEVYRINGRKPTHAMFTKYTRKRPAKYAEATWDTQGRLHLRLWR